MFCHDYISRASAKIQSAPKNSTYFEDFFGEIDFNFSARTLNYLGSNSGENAQCDASPPFFHFLRSDAADEVRMLFDHFFFVSRLL